MRLMRFAGNWLFILSSPIWVLPVFMTVSVWSMIDPNKYPDYWDIVSGRTWIL